MPRTLSVDIPDGKLLIKRISNVNIKFDKPYKAMFDEGDRYSKKNGNVYVYKKGRWVQEKKEEYVFLSAAVRPPHSYFRNTDYNPGFIKVPKSCYGII
jgi:hypothetical protein